MLVIIGHRTIDQTEPLVTLNKNMLSPTLCVDTDFSYCCLSLDKPEKLSYTIATA